MRRFRINQRLAVRPLVAIALVLSLASAGRADFISGLQGYWQFEGNGLDSSGNARGLNLVGNPGFGAGFFGQALSLVGNPSQFAARPGSDPIFDLGSSDFTIQLWANFNNTAGEQTLFEKFTGGSGPGYSLTKLPSNVLRFTLPSNTRFLPGGTERVLDSGVLDFTPGQDKWHQILARRTGSTVDLLFDGSPLPGISATDAAAYPSSPNPLLIGERDGGQQFPVNGRMDEVAFWTRALSNNEVNTLWNNGQGTQLTAVPEPASLTLAALGSLGLLGYAWRRRKG